MRVSKMGGFCSEEKDEVVRVSSPGLLSRKPEKKAAFARKKALDNMHPQSKYSQFTTRVSKEKRSPNTHAIPSTISLKVINPHIQEDIKYLSPKHSHSALIQFNAAKTPENSYSTCLHSTLDEMFMSECMQTPSGISIQGLGAKTFVSGEPSGRDWFGLEAQNQKLREQNSSLKQQIQRLKEQLQFQQFDKVYRPKVQPPKCKYCSCFKSQKKQLQSTLQSSKKQIQLLKAKVSELKLSLQQEQQTISLLSSQLNQSRQCQDHLQSLLNSLKQKIESDTSQLRYLNIQQDLLMRKKDELEKVKLQNIKRDIQRNNMKKMLNQYKEKIEILRRTAHNRKNRKEQVQISLDLSLDSSINR